MIHSDSLRYRLLAKIDDTAQQCSASRRYCCGDSFDAIVYSVASLRRSSVISSQQATTLSIAVTIEALVLALMTPVLYLPRRSSLMNDRRPHVAVYRNYAPLHGQDTPSWSPTLTFLRSNIVDDSTHCLRSCVPAIILHSSHPRHCLTELMNIVHTSLGSLNSHRWGFIGQQTSQRGCTAGKRCSKKIVRTSHLYVQLHKLKQGWI